MILHSEYELLPSDAREQGFLIQLRMFGDCAILLHYELRLRLGIAGDNLILCTRGFHIVSFVVLLSSCAFLCIEFVSDARTRWP